MKPRSMLVASAVTVAMLAAGCSSSGTGSGTTTHLKPEKTDITVAAFPAIDSAGLYIAQDDGLFAAQGLHVTVVPFKGVPPSTQDLINGQVAGKYDITAGDYVTYIEDQLGVDGAPQHDLRLVAEASFLQPNVLTVMVKGGSEISQVSQLKGKNVSVNAPNDIGTLLIDSLLVSHGLTPRQVHYTTVPFPGVATALTEAGSTLTAAFAPEPFVSAGEAGAGLEELADLDQGSTQDFPVQGYAVTADWAKQNPNTLKAFTAALSQGQQIADTDRAETEAVIEKYLGVDKQSAAFISLPAFPLGVDAVRIQRVVSAMSRFGLLPKGTSFKVTTMIGS
jgi:NitT/TauT family transport system substrate-binding protein